MEKHVRQIIIIYSDCNLYCFLEHRLCHFLFSYFFSSFSRSFERSSRASPDKLKVIKKWRKKLSFRLVTVICFNDAAIKKGGNNCNEEIKANFYSLNLSSWQRKSLHNKIRKSILFLNFSAYLRFHKNSIIIDSLQQKFFHILLAATLNNV